MAERKPILSTVDANEVPDGHVSIDIDWSPEDDNDEVGAAEGAWGTRIGVTLTLRIETADAMCDALIAWRKARKRKEARRG